MTTSSGSALMEIVTDPSLPAIPVSSLRNLQSAGFQQQQQQHHHHHHHHPLTPSSSQIGPDYDIDPANFHPYDINDVRHDVDGQVRAYSQSRQNVQTPVGYSQESFNVITTDQQRQWPQQQQQQQQQQDSHVAFQLNHEESPTKEIGGHFSGMKAISDPPDLQHWREKLFNVNEMITLTESEFQTYFPHVDNIYSHRSTQRYKRKPFVSHYWDCRLKGRPPGTPKTDDPGKKKRRRTARQRDLCDVKIKITEYFPGAAAAAMLMVQRPGFGAGVDAIDYVDQDGREPAQPFGVLAPTSTLPPGHPGAGGARYYTIQRVNGGGGGGGGGSNGKENDSAGHKHTLEDSDVIKKNSVRRKMLKEEKERKRTDAVSKSTTSSAPATLTNPCGSALAISTARRHSKPADIVFYTNPVCPYAQRIWIALEIKEIPYQYVEIHHGHTPPPEMVEVNPDKRLPCIKHGDWGVWESPIVVEYLEDLSMGHSLLPLADPQTRAHCRMWADHISRKIIPSFDSLLIATCPNKQSVLASTLQSAITALVNASHVAGPFFLGPNITFVDVMFAPWIIRLSRVLKHYRQWPDPEAGSRWERWVLAVEADERVRRTVNEERSYQAFYEGASKGAANNRVLEWGGVGSGAAERWDRMETDLVRNA